MLCKEERGEERRGSEGRGRAGRGVLQEGEGHDGWEAMRNVGGVEKGRGEVQD